MGGVTMTQLDPKWWTDDVIGPDGRPEPRLAPFSDNVNEEILAVTMRNFAWEIGQAIQPRRIEIWGTGEANPDPNELGPPCPIPSEDFMPPELFASGPQPPPNNPAFVNWYLARKEWVKGDIILDMTNTLPNGGFRIFQMD